MKVIIRETKREASIWAARHIVAAIKAKAAVILRILLRPRVLAELSRQIFLF